MPTLTIQFPGLPPVAHVLREETTTIGRMKGSTIVVDDNSVSLMHAKITRSKEGEYFLKDLNSTNGTLLNGQTVREARLQNLDQICFADIIAQFHADVVAPVAPITPLTPSPSVGTAPVIGAPPPPAKPTRASQPIATADAAKPRRSHSSPTNAVTKLADRAVPILGGVAAVVIVSILVWKLFLAKGHSGDMAEANPPASAPGTKSTPSVITSNKAVVVRPTPPPAPKPPQNAPPPKPENATISRLVVGLKDADAEERRRAARALHSVGAEAKEAIVPLREALKDADEEVQMWAALTLVNNKSYDKAAIPILVRSIRHDNPRLREVVCLSLAIIPYEGAEKDTVVPPLAAIAANDDDEEVRKAAYSALTIIAPEIIAKANEK